MDSSPVMNRPSPNDVLEQQSRSHLAHVLDASSSGAGAVAAAYQAGYCALMASLRIPRDPGHRSALMADSIPL